MPKETYLPSLFSLFRQYGYDGATLSKISQTTGLSKASLYHHFPGGKDDMMQSVLGYSSSWLEENVLSILNGDGGPQERLQNMCDRFGELYAGGTQPCLLAVLQSGTGRDLFHPQVKATLEALVAAIAALLVEAGIDPTTAQQRGEEALVKIQGSLMVAQSLDNPALFQRVVEALPQTLLQA